MEIWKEVFGYEGLYKVSNTGKIKRLKKKVFQKNKKIEYVRIFEEKIISQTNNGNGYYHVKLRKNKINKTLYVHRIVAKAFLENTENKRTINHIDGNKSNNNVENLEWSTQSENNHHAHNNNLAKSPKGSKNGLSKLTENEVLKIRKMYKSGMRPTDIAKLFNVKQPAISKIIHRRIWKHI